MAQAKIQTDAIILNPIDPAEAPPNSIFIDENAPDVVSVSNSSGEQTQSNPTLKVVVNGFGAEIPAGKPLSKKSDGTVIPADSDAAGGQAFIGINPNSIPFPGSGQIVLVAPNVPGVLTGLGFAPGEDVFISETGTYTNNPADFTGGDDSIIKAGVADCADGIASPNATDLILLTEVLLRP